MGDIFSLMNEEVDAGKFDGVERREGQCAVYSYPPVYEDR